MATKRTSTTKKSDKTPSGTKKNGPPQNSATLVELRRIARAIVTSTSVADAKRTQSLYAETVEFPDLAGHESTAHGLQGLTEELGLWDRRTSDSRWHARNLWCDGQTIIIEWEARMASRPGGREELHREVAIHEIRNGKIVRERFYHEPTPGGAAKPK